MTEKSTCCGPCDCTPNPIVPRRDFVKYASLTVTNLVLAKMPAMAGPFDFSDFDNLVPANKKLHPAWVQALFERGVAEVYQGDQLEHVGMPVGGIACGQLYLGGDGRLWHWDIFSTVTTSDYQGSAARGLNYEHPLPSRSPIEQGFAIEVARGGQTSARFLDSRGFAETTFRGEYPIGRVTYRVAEFPVQVELEAFSPFIPLNVTDSSLPATILAFKVQNTTEDAIEARLVGWLENAVCRASDGGLTLTRRNQCQPHNDRTSVTSTIELTDSERTLRPDKLFEAWQESKYEGWNVEGDAFGSGPIRRDDLPKYQGDVGGIGDHLVNSHAAAPGETIAAKDQRQGKLTSRSFTIERDFIALWVGGGANPGRTCVNLVVDGTIVASVTGANDNRMSRQWLDARRYQDKKAVIEIIDSVSTGWGNIGVGQIIFTDSPPTNRLEELPGAGTLSLSLLGEQQGVTATASISQTADVERIFGELCESPRSTSTAPHAERPPISAIQKTLALPPGGKATVVYLITWSFPHIGAKSGEMAALTDAPMLKRHYATRFADAQSVASYVTENLSRLTGDTRLWSKTWYDSTLPCWFLDRTMIPVDCLATQTFFGFNNGRWWGWEGVNCCPGTCQHVWQYAQSLARLFPAIERDLRERVDFGLAWRRNGTMDHRAENARNVAHDGFCGTIVRVYREHRMSADGAFLRRLWPRVRKSLEWIMHQDRDRDGLLEGEQMNTLDAVWVGPMGWISSLYLAALAAGEAMAIELGETDFATRCRKILDAGRREIVARLFNGEYFIHLPTDEKHTNTNDGCHIDQVLGQSFAFQVGLPRVIPQPQAISALRSLWKYNFSPDVGVYRAGMKPIIPKARWYAMPGEAGLLMCTWPRGGAERAPGGGNSPFVGYFIECMTGFEYQVAAHMIWEGLIEEGLAITRSVHDRYAASKRNPYNEIECSDHYSRAMMSYGVFLAACGYDYHGPHGRLGIAPRLTPEAFRAPFTAAEGWGSLSQQRQADLQEMTIELTWGNLRLRHLAFELADGAQLTKAIARHGSEQIEATSAQHDRRVEIDLAENIVLRPGEKLTVALNYTGDTTKKE